MKRKYGTGYHNILSMSILFWLANLVLLPSCLKESQFTPNSALQNEHLFVNPNVALVGQPFTIYAFIKVDSTKVVEGNTLWIKRMPDNAAAEIIMPLYDNGDYTNNDYIAGDFQYNGLLTYIQENEVDTIKYAAIGNVLQPDGSYQEEELGHDYMKVYNPPTD